MIAGYRWVTRVALAACAGAIDLLAVAGFHGAFASIVTGNLVTSGLGIGTTSAAIAGPPIVAIAGYAVGVAGWQWLWRGRPAAIVALVAAELAVVVLLTIGWWLSHTRPVGTASLVLLGLAALAMGGQSVAALRLHASTTYLTGTLTGAVHDLVVRRPGSRRSAVRQLVALAGGATLAAVLLVHLRWAVPLLPVGLLVIVVLVHRPAVPGPPGSPSGADAPR